MTSALNLGSQCLPSKLSMHCRIVNPFGLWSEGHQNDSLNTDCSGRKTGCSMDIVWHRHSWREYENTNHQQIASVK